MIPPSDNIKIERVTRTRRMVPLLPTIYVYMYVKTTILKTIIGEERG